MPFILAIEPDRRQASRIAALARDPLKVELLVTESAERALAMLSKRIPDVILTSLLLSPKDEAALDERLRELDAAGAHIPTLMIPVLAPVGRRASRPDGLLTRLRRPRAKPAPHGCDPSVFAAQIAEYLEGAAADRAISAARVEDDVPYRPQSVEAHSEPQASSSSRSDGMFGFSRTMADSRSDGVSGSSRAIPASKTRPDDLKHAPVQLKHAPVQQEDIGTPSTALKPDPIEPFPTIDEARSKPLELETPVTPIELQASFTPGAEPATGADTESIFAAATPEVADVVVASELTSDSEAPDAELAASTSTLDTRHILRAVAQVRPARTGESWEEIVFENDEVPSLVISSEPIDLAKFCEELKQSLEQEASTDLDGSIELDATIALEETSADSPDIQPKVEAPEIVSQSHDDSELEDEPDPTADDFDFERDLWMPLPIAAHRGWPVLEGPMIRAVAQQNYGVAPDPAVEFAVPLPSSSGKERARSPQPQPQPVQDESGFFDPQQCGFAALLAKLEEVTHDDRTPASEARP